MQLDLLGFVMKIALVAFQEPEASQTRDTTKTLTV